MKGKDIKQSRHTKQTKILRDWENYVNVYFNIRNAVETGRTFYNNKKTSSSEHDTCQYTVATQPHCPTTCGTNWLNEKEKDYPALHWYFNISLIFKNYIYLLYVWDGIKCVCVCACVCWGRGLYPCHSLVPWELRLLDLVANAFNPLSHPAGPSIFLFH
jgi:hypothetical protein